MKSPNCCARCFTMCLLVFLCISFSASAATGDPNIVVDPNLFAFSAFEGGADPDAQLMTITNGAGGTLNWSIDTSGQPDWLTITPTGGSLAHDESEPVTLSVDIAGLSAGQYRYSFEIVAPSADNSPQRVTVELEVIGPILNVSKKQFTFTSLEGDVNPAGQVLTISNSGYETLTWLAGITGKPDWLAVMPTSGSLDPNESELMTLTVDVTGLSAGQYSYSFEISDPAADNSPQTLTVELEAIGPILNVSSNVFTFTGNEGDGDLIDQTLTVRNSGGGVVNWSIPDANLIMLPDWLTMSQTSGSLDPNESDSVMLSVDISGLSDGSYSYSFDVVAPSAQNSPQTIIVSLGVGGIHVPGNYSTIQAAIDAAVEGDTITVAPGTYVENIYFGGKNIILTSSSPESSEVVASTIIDGGNSGTVVRFYGTETTACELRGFTIQNGRIAGVGAGVSSGGVRVGPGDYHGTFATIANCVITKNIALPYADLCTYMPGEGGGLANCDGLIVNCTIADNTAGWGGGLYDCNGSIANCTIADNVATYVGGGLIECFGSIVNCIIWDNSLEYCSVPTYSCIQDWTGGGTGNTSVNPLFADAYYGDYHLKSEYGRLQPHVERWNDNGTPADANDNFWEEIPAAWLYDDTTSACIDAGDPASDWTGELWPHGGRINMGAYGGTPAASMSGNPIGNVADVDHDDAVGISDFLLFSDDWLYAEYLLDTDMNRDGRVDIADFAEFARQWMWVE